MSSLFLSTPSARRATRALAWLLLKIADFYPRPPRGGRPRVVAVVADPDLFLSTPSARRATLLRLSFADCGMISIHALREEGDSGLRHETLKPHNFYPRPPRGGRRGRTVQPDEQLKISIHALREEGDGGFSYVPTLRKISIHALREEGDKAARTLDTVNVQFLSTPSARRATERFNHYIDQVIFLSTPSARRATTG